MWGDRRRVEGGKEGDWVRKESEKEEVERELEKTRRMCGGSADR